jgi:hypothetical protein
MTSDIEDIEDVLAEEECHSTYLNARKDTVGKTLDRKKITKSQDVQRAKLRDIKYQPPSD